MPFHEGCSSASLFREEGTGRFRIGRGVENVWGETRKANASPRAIGERLPVRASAGTRFTRLRDGVRFAHRLLSSRGETSVAVRVLPPRFKLARTPWIFEERASPNRLDVAGALNGPSSETRELARTAPATASFSHRGEVGPAGLLADPRGVEPWRCDPSSAPQGRGRSQPTRGLRPNRGPDPRVLVPRWDLFGDQ